MEHNGSLHLVKLKAESGDTAKRIAILREAARQITCYSARESNRNVAEFYQALYRETLVFADGGEFEDLLYLREQIEQYELGYEQAGERYQTGLRALMYKG